ILWVSSSVVVVQHFFFTDTATTLLYSLSLHDALPISEFIKLVAEGQRVKINVVDEAMKSKALGHLERAGADLGQVDLLLHPTNEDRKSTRLNSSHVKISYAVFCLKKKNTNTVKTVSFH